MAGKKSLIAYILLMAGLFGCLPDRMPPDPVENQRPEFRYFGQNDNATLNVPLNDPILMVFSEKMDLSTFPDNFKVESVSGAIPGTFEYVADIDSAVLFRPSENYNPAEVYQVSLSGGVRDIHGNSMIAPYKEDQPVTAWFFTTGQYGENGFPYVFIRDKSEKQIIHRVGKIDQYLDSLYMQADEEDYQTSNMKFTPDGQYLLVLNIKISKGTVTVIDPASLNTVRTLEVGLGPTNLTFTSDGRAIVANNSAKSFSVIDLSSLSVERTVPFTDGYKPKGVVYSPVTDRLYFFSSNNYKIRVVKASDYTVEKDLENVLVNNKKAADMEISPDGSYIYLAESRSDKVIVLDVQSEEALTIETGYGYNIDGVMSQDAYFLNFFRKVDKDFVGGILKIDLASQTIVDQLIWEKDMEEMDLTHGDELLYAITPQDSTVQIIETRTLKPLSQVKVPGSLKYIAISKNNYQN
ncbi:Ig-like domain-containing protein [Caldithrix abyssi]